MVTPHNPPNLRGNFPLSSSKSYPCARIPTRESFRIMEVTQGVITYDESALTTNALLRIGSMHVLSSQHTHLANTQ